MSNGKTNLLLSGCYCCSVLGTDLDEYEKDIHAAIVLEGNGDRHVASHGLLQRWFSVSSKSTKTEDNFMEDYRLFYQKT